MNETFQCEPGKFMVENSHAVYLDDDRNIREIMVELLALAAGIQCHAFPTVSEFTAQSELVLHSRIAILDINLGPDQPNGLDALDWLRAQGYRGKVAFLTGHALSHPLVRQASALKGVEILEKPVGLNRLLQLIQAAPQAGEER